MIKINKTISCAVLIVALLLSLTVNVFALPYDSYQYNGKDEAVAVTPSCEPLKTQSAFGDYVLSEPQDMHVTEEGIIYIADTKNDRILVLDSNLNYKNVIQTFGAGETLSKPEGVTTDTDGLLYIADTGNKRIVVLNEKLEVDRILGAVTADILPEDFEYKPSKLTVDDAGRIFVVVRNFNMGIIELNAKGEFVSTLGAPPVTYTIAELIKRFFTTKEQRAKMLSFVPSEYNNLDVDQEGFVFVTTSSDQSLQPQQITPVRRLNAKGNDVLIRLGFPVGDLEVANHSAGQSLASQTGTSAIVDVTPMDYQMYAILDQKRGRVFAYNKDGEAVFLFGGIGSLQGTSSTATALGYYGEKFYVLDMSKASVTVYGLTEYGKMLINAQKYKFEGNFEAEKEAWHAVYAMNENNQIVTSQLAKIAYNQRDMVTAMKYAKQAGDVETYSKAFQFYRRDFINNYAGWMVFGVVVLVVIVQCVRKLCKKYLPQRAPGALAYAKHVMFHPMDGFWDLKYEKRGSLKVALFFYAGLCVTMVLSGQFSGFIVNAEKPALLTSLLTVLLPSLLWCVGVRCVTSLMDGEGTTKEIIIATGYSLAPLIPIQLIAIVMSNVMIATEQDFYSLLLTLGLVWVAWLLVCSVKQTHDYSMSKTVGVILISLLCIAIILFLAMLAFALSQQMYAFVKDFIAEAKLHM